MSSNRTLRTCPQGHQYYKSSDCPTCPVCEQMRKPVNSFMMGLSAPARRALESHGITTIKKLASFTEKEILSFHGMGPASLPALAKALRAARFSFKKPQVKKSSNAK